MDPWTPGHAATKVHEMAQVLDPTTIRLLGWLVDRSKRTSGVALSIPFLRREDRAQVDPPPLAHMIRGGRGGGVRLKLYLSMSLLATRRPHDVKNIPARVWAEMFALPDPETNGARRITDALGWLADHKLIRAERQRGRPATIYLLNQSGTGGRFVRPRGRWVTVPVDFWRAGWIAHLSGSATALLLILLEMQGGKKPQDPPWIAPAEARHRYDLSADTWSRASRELVDAGLLTIRRTNQGKAWDWRRLRNTYWVDIDRLSSPP